MMNTNGLENIGSMKKRRSFLQGTLAVGLLSRQVYGGASRSPVETGNPYGVSEQDAAWMKQATLKQLAGCRVKGHGGTWIHTPDGVGNYKALWTRDFYYMVEYAGDLLAPDEITSRPVFRLITGGISGFF